ncbi:hypothetical protein NP284_37355 [Rhodopseudomonas pseudopalustris]
MAIFACSPPLPKRSTLVAWFRFKARDKRITLGFGLKISSIAGKETQFPGG